MSDIQNESRICQVQLLGLFGQALDLTQER
jgi:hypothetical protein